MLDEETKKNIADYVLDQNDPERLNISVMLHESWEAIRSQVINEFSNQFVRAIVDDLPPDQGWIVNADDILRRPLVKFTGLEVRHPTWDNGLYVGIEAQTEGPGSWIIGAWGEVGYQHEKLRNIISECMGVGRINSKWLWFRYFSDTTEFGHWELGDWRMGAAIVAMREGLTGDYGKKLRERIVDLCKAVDGVFSSKY